MIDPGPARQSLGETLPVETPRPRHVAGRVVLPWPLRLEQGLCLTVAELLFHVGAKRVPAMVPDHRRGAEAHREARVPEPPADVDVVAGPAEARIEPPDRLQGRLPEGHVAAGNV